MSRYIDADKLEFLCAYNDRCIANLEECKECYDYVCGFMDIQKQPTADVVEVVRCRDCKHYVLNTFGIKFCSESRGLTLPYDETFCSYGERKVQE